jgi:hypothetical protein
MRFHALSRFSGSMAPDIPKRLEAELGDNALCLPLIAGLY